MRRGFIVVGIFGLAAAVIAAVGLWFYGPAVFPPMVAQQGGAGLTLCAKRSDGSVVCEELGQPEPPEGDCYAALNGPVCENPFEATHQ